MNRGRAGGWASPLWPARHPQPPALSKGPTGHTLQGRAGVMVTFQGPTFLITSISESWSSLEENTVKRKSISQNLKSPFMTMAM